MPVGLQAPVYQVRYFDTLGGVNNSLPDELIADNEWSDAANYQPDRINGKGICKRLGLVQVSSAQTATTYSVYQGKLANYFHAGTIVKNFAGTTLVQSMAAAYDSWSSYLAYDFFVNGTDAQKTADGAAFTAISNIPSGTKYVCSANNFVYGAGHSHGSLRYANYGTLETWPVGNELVLTQDENDDMTGLLKVVNGVLIMCAKSFYIVNGTSNLDQQVSFYSKQDGSSASRSLIFTPYGVFFWSLSGMCWMKNDYTLDYPMVRKLAATLAGLNRAQDANVHGVWDSQEQRVRYWLFTGASSTANLLLDYYPQFDAFFLHTGAAAAMSASGPAIITGVPSTHCGGYASSTYLYKLTGATDDSVAISAYLETKREAYGNSNFLKRGRIVNLTTAFSTGGALNYKCYVDNETSVATANTWALTAATGLSDNVIGLNRAHYKIKHRVDDGLSTQTFIRQLQHDGYVVRSR